MAIASGFLFLLGLGLSLEIGGSAEQLDPFAAFKAKEDLWVVGQKFGEFLFGERQGLVDVAFEDCFSDFCISVSICTFSQKGMLTLSVYRLIVLRWLGCSTWY